MKDKEEGKEFHEALASLERCCPGSTRGSTQHAASKVLHKALLELERARKESTALLEGMNAIISSESSQLAFTIVLEQLKLLIGFDYAFVLRHQQEDEMLSVVASTSYRFDTTKWKIGPVFKKVLSGITYNFKNLKECPEWLDQDPKVIGQSSSALHAPFYTKTGKAMCVCVSNKENYFSKNHINILERFSPLAGQALHNLEINELLRDEITERKKAEESLRETMAIHLQKAHEAGMAEMASEVLHNIGNAITPAQILASNIIKALQRSPLRNDLASCLQEFQEAFGSSPSIEKIEKQRLDQIAKHLPTMVTEELDNYLADIRKISDKHKHIVSIINLQNSYGRIPGYYEDININQLIDDALKMMDESIRSHKIQLVRQYGYLDKIHGEKTKLMHVLMNLIKNGQEAMHDTPVDKRQLKINTWMETGNPTSIFCSLQDTGCGFIAEEKAKLFSFGYTTKKKGFGFGLHSCANYLISCGGKIEAMSDGPSRGAKFIIQLPVIKKT